MKFLKSLDCAKDAQEGSTKVLNVSQRTNRSVESELHRCHLLPFVCCALKKGVENIPLQTRIHGETGPATHCCMGNPHQFKRVFVLPVHTQTTPFAHKCFSISRSPQSDVMICSTTVQSTAPHPSHHLEGLEVKAPASSVIGPRFAQGQSHASDLKTGVSVAALSDCIGTGLGLAGQMSVTG